MSDDPLTQLEGEHAMRQMAAMVRVWYTALVDEGFSEAEALRLTIAYVSGLASGAR